MNKSLLVIALAFALISCGNSQAVEKRKAKIKQMENAALTQDQIDRKEQSIKFCKSRGIPTISHLPSIESEGEVNIRSKDEIVNRALVLCYLGLKSEGLEEEHLLKFENKYDLSSHFTPEELKYKNTSSPNKQDTINANWRYESLHVLLWTLGYIDSLSYPSEMCAVADDVKLIFKKSKKEFIDGARLRSKKEILDEADLIYRIHWATVNARVNKEANPANLDTSVVYERHYCLNWLINYMDQDWDDVSTDT